MFYDVVFENGDSARIECTGMAEAEKAADELAQKRGTTVDHISSVLDD